MGAVKIVIMAMKKSDFDSLLKKIKEDVVKDTTCWQDGPYETRQGFKAYLTFEVAKNDD